MRGGELNTRVSSLSTGGRVLLALGPSWPAIGEGRHPFFRWPSRLPIGSHSSKPYRPRRAASHPGPGLCGTSFVPSPTKKWLGEGYEGWGSRAGPEHEGALTTPSCDATHVPFQHLAVVGCRTTHFGTESLY